MKVGDLVKMPAGAGHDTVGLIVSPPQKHRPNRVGVWWFEDYPEKPQRFFVDYELINLLEVVSESRNG